MDEKTKLILALQQINNLSELLSENEWKTHFYSHLIPVEVELKRQLSLL